MFTFPLAENFVVRKLVQALKQCSLPKFSSIKVTTFFKGHSKIYKLLILECNFKLEYNFKTDELLLN